MHLAKAVGRNEMPFGRDTHVVPTNIVFDRAPDSPREGEFWGSEPTAYCRITFAVIRFDLETTWDRRMDGEKSVMEPLTTH